MRTAFGVAFGVITLLTLCPIQYRPTTGHVALERFVAFGLLGALSVFAFPHRLRRNLIMVAAIALALEAGQRLTSSRDGRVLDLLEKLAGGGAGIIAASWIMPAGASSRRRRRGRSARVVQIGAPAGPPLEAPAEPARKRAGGRA